MPSIIKVDQIQSDTGNVVFTGNVNIDSGLLFVDGTNNRVGIGNIRPQGTLDVGGLASGSGGDLLVTTGSTTAQVTVGRLSGTNDDNTMFRVRGRGDQTAFFVHSGNRTANVGLNFAVGGATPATSGSGITFPSSQNASTDPNTLDDYEEGTFDVGVSGAGGPTITSQYNTYTKVGRLVTVNISILIRQNTATGGQAILNLPFNSVNTTNYVATGVGYWENSATSIISSFCRVGQNSTSLSISRTTAATPNPAAWQGADWQSASDTVMTFTITYMTA